MKLKKILSGIVASAMAFTTMAFAPMTASALQDAPAGTSENVLAVMAEASSFPATMSQWGTRWMQCYEGELSNWIKADNTYLKVTLSAVGTYTGDDGKAVEIQDIVKWDGFEGWFHFCSIDERKYFPVSGITSNGGYVYAPLSDFQLNEYNGIGFNFQCGHPSSMTIEKAEIVEVSTDTTVYATQNVELAELADDVMKLPGTIDTSKISGISAGIEVTFTTSGAYGGFKLLDATDEANVDFTNSLAEAQGTDTVGQFTKFIKFSDFTVPSKIWINVWSVASIDSVKIVNDSTKGNVYTVPVLPTDISLDESALTLTAGTAPIQLTATVEPADAEYAIEWTSDNEAVATVDAAGKVTPVAAGKATITAAITGTGLSASCVVTVSDAVIAPTSITLDKPTLSLAKGGAPAKLTATILPKGAVAEIEWTSSNPAAATVDATGNVTAVAVGEAVITATVKGTALSAACTVNVIEQADTGYTSPELPAVNVVSTQKTPVVNGKYNERVVKVVSAADLNGAEEVVFTLSNGTKTVTKSVSKYYTGLHVNGNAYAAADGTVILCLTIKDIPDGVTVTCTNIEIKK